MATRSIIAEPYGDGWRGRYCHWDGYPSAKSQELMYLVARDGVDKVRQVLLHDYQSWSHLDPFTLDSTKPSGVFVEETEGRFALVNGYGSAHTDLKEDEPFYTHEHPHLGWACFLYILGDKSLFVSEIAWGGDTKRDTLSPLKELGKYENALSLT